jgi:hypothetical protein
MSRCRIAFFVALLFAVPAVVAAAPAPDASMQLPPQPKVRPAGLPADAVMVSPCVATMGEHWIALKDAPLGPIYGTYKGKLVFTEIMVTQKQLNEGFSYGNIRALPGYTIDHIDFKYEPTGHAGLPVPHYDLHAYYVSPTEEAAICPDGIPDPSMKAMNE